MTVILSFKRKNNFNEFVIKDLFGNKVSPNKIRLDLYSKS